MTRRFPLARTLGALLPLCLLWVFIACVALCLYHGEDEHGAVVVDALYPRGDEDCCPVADNSDVVLPERHSFVPRPDDRPHSRPAVPPAPPEAFASGAPCALDVIAPPSSGPPAESHAVLRM